MRFLPWIFVVVRGGGGSGGVVDGFFSTVDICN